MFCPKCGQQQISDQTRFCSRCGLAISALGEYITGAAARSASQDEGAQPLPTSAKRRGMRRGAKVMFASGVLTPIFLCLSLFVDNIALLLVPLSVFLAGLSLMLYAWLFGDDIPAPRLPQSQPTKLASTFSGATLAPASELGVNGLVGRRVRTAELAQRPSVTEHTTKLLDND